MLSDGAFGFLGSLGSSALSFAGASHGAYKQYQYQKKLQKYAYNISRKYRQTAYQDTRSDLEKANYNPMLAVSQGSTSSGMASAGSAQSEDYSGAVNSAMDYARYRLEKNLNKEVVDKTHEEKLNLETQTYGQSIQNYYAPSIAEAQIAQIQSATALQQMQTLAQQLENQFIPDKRKAEIYNLYSTAQSMAKSANASMIGANAQVTSANAAMKSAGASEKQADTGQWSAIGQGIMAGLGIGAFGAGYLKNIKAGKQVFNSLHFK